MDDTQRARELAKKIIKLADNCNGVADCLDMMEEQIGDALTQARREGMNEAVKVVRKKAGEPWKSEAVKRELGFVAQAIREQAKG